MSKPPCALCARHRELEPWDGLGCESLTRHFCVTDKVNHVTGEHVEHGCWWYRRTPFCEFESIGLANVKRVLAKLTEAISNAMGSFEEEASDD